jgi:hypothetical protein
MSAESTALKASILIEAQDWQHREADDHLALARSHFARAIDAKDRKDLAAYRTHMQSAMHWLRAHDVSHALAYRDADRLEKLRGAK